MKRKQLFPRGDKAEINWPDNSIPKAGFKASQTLVATGEKITLESTSSDNTKEITWSLPDSVEEKAKGKSVTVSYDKEGVYDVTLKAKNDKGSAEETAEGYIVVISKLPGDLTLLSGGKETEATSYVNNGVALKYAVDRDISKKWCATGTHPHGLTIDLGETAVVSQMAISHAKACGEVADMNTKAYSISISTDGKEFKEVATVTKNTSGSTLDTFAPAEASYVKLSIEKPTQGSDTAARIYEVEVFGMKGTL